MQIVDDKALVLRTRNPHKYAIIPKHKIISESEGIFEVAVYWASMSLAYYATLV